jgi:hypothetical protein
MQSRRRPVVIWTLAVCAASAAALAISKQRSWRRRWHAWAAAVNFMESFKIASEVALDVTTNTKAYLNGSVAEPPFALVRSLELLSSKPVANALEQLTKHILPPSDGPTIVDTLVEASLTERGQSLIALVASICTTRAVQVLTRWAERNAKAANIQPSSENDHCGKFASWLSGPQGHALISRCITEFVSTGVTSYCRATNHINPYDQVLQAASKPEHLKALRALTATFCETSVRACADLCQPHPSGHNCHFPPSPTPKNGIIHPPVRFNHRIHLPKPARSPQISLACTPEDARSLCRCKEHGFSRNLHITLQSATSSVDMDHTPSSTASPPTNHERCSTQQQPLEPLCHTNHLTVEPTLGVAHALQPQLNPSWLAALTAASASADVRRLCAEAAHAGCAGAVQAAVDCFSDVASTNRLLDERMRRLLVFGVVLWSLVLPLMLFYMLTCCVV